MKRSGYGFGRSADDSILPSHKGASASRIPSPTRVPGTYASRRNSRTSRASTPQR